MSKESRSKYRYRRISNSDCSGTLNEDGSEETYELQQREIWGQIHANQYEQCPTNKLIEDYDSFFDRTIQQGESLASIALKYRIPVSELKRVNHLQKEVEFYGLKSLKIPVKANSELLEMLTAEETTDKKVPNGTHPCIKASPSSGSEMESENDVPTGVVSISQILREKHSRKEAREFLKNMQKDLANIQRSTDSYKTSLEDASNALTDIRFLPLESQNQFKCSGDDMGFSWWKVVTIGLCILIGAPVIYFFYYSSHNHQ